MRDAPPDVPPTTRPTTLPVDATAPPAAPADTTLGIPTVDAAVVSTFEMPDSMTGNAPGAVVEPVEPACNTPSAWAPRVVTIRFPDVDCITKPYCFSPVDVVGNDA